MKLPWILFGFLVAMCGVGAYVLYLDPPTEAAGVAHQTFETMQRGGDGTARHQAVLRAGWLIGILQIGFFVGLVALGSRRHRAISGVWRHFLGGGLLYAATFTAMVVAYRTYAADTLRPLFLSMPTPTAWMLYGLWPLPIYFLVLYMWHFESWIFSPGDAERFQQIVDRRRGREG